MPTSHIDVASTERTFLIGDAVEQALAMMTLLHLAGIETGTPGRLINLVEDIKRLRVALRFLEVDGYRRH